MIPLKTKKEIQIMEKGGQILARVMATVMTAARPGVKTKTLDVLAEKLIIKAGAKPSFKMVDNYCWTSCINLNDGLVHGVPREIKIKTGDVVTIDLGVYYQGFHTDMARTFYVAANSSTTAREHTGCVPQTQHHTRCEGIAEVSLGGNSEVKRFLRTGHLALKKAIAAAQPGNYLGDISQTIQNVVEKAGYSCSRKYTGHGIGRKLHEEPRIPCCLSGKIKETPRLKIGMVLAIEVIYSQGKPAVKISRDGWTAKTTDGKLGGLFENTVAITKAGPSVLTMVKYQD